jgi:hypothetical protein
MDEHHQHKEVITQTVAALAGGLEQPAKPPG